MGPCYRPNKVNDLISKSHGKATKMLLHGQLESPFAYFDKVKKIPKCQRRAKRQEYTHASNKIVKTLD